jgi:hypothetical protein
MPAMIDAPEVVEYTEQDYSEEQPKIRRTRLGFWQRVKQYVKRHRVHTPRSTPTLSQGSLHPMEMPADLLARQYPSLYIQASCGV